MRTPIPSTTAGEQRSGPRFAHDELGVQLPGLPAELDPALFDVSERGLGVQLAQPLEPGFQIRFMLPLPEGPVEGLGEVRWTKPHHLGHRCGIRIVHMPWLQARRLRYFLVPEEDPIKAVDWGLKLGAALVIALLGLDLVGLSMDKIFQLFKFLLDSFLHPK